MDPHTSFSLHRDLSTILYSACFYSGCHLVFDAIWKRTLGHKYYKLRKSDRISLPEKISSIIHATYVSVLSSKILFVDCAYSHDTLNAYPLGAHRLFLHYTGYNIYDILTMIMQGDQHWTMWLHHIMGLYGSTLMLYFKKPSFYPFIFFLSEATAITNNLCWYASLLSFKSTSLVKLNVLRAISFVLARVWIGPYAIWRAFEQADYNLQTLWNQWTTQLHPIASTLSVINLILLSYLNFGWTVATIKIALRSLGLRKSSKIKIT
ncbi:hypothetical protein HMI54_004759 [Coelomomyces lativittatus]|nr:hypothetical protein HMI54_004759 [Coelomomyces lativittatus]KAJ1510461.1 hypothetical protein HMI56_006330 [Coelomomyces lativittatus]